VSVTLASGLLTNVVWARLCDQRGNRVVMLATTMMAIVFCLLSALVTSLPASAYYTGVEQALLLGLFALGGTMLAGANLVSNPLMIEIA
jgi:MFS family permease